jgi:hypothetical protein
MPFLRLGSINPPGVRFGTLEAQQRAWATNKALIANTWVKTAIRRKFITVSFVRYLTSEKLFHQNGRTGINPDLLYTTLLVESKCFQLSGWPWVTHKEPTGFRTGR